LRVTAFLDGRPGHGKQTLGVLHALSCRTPVEAACRDLPQRTPWGETRLWGLFFLSAMGAGRLRAPCAQAGRPPDLVLGAGTRTHLPMILCQRGSGARAVVCMTPGWPLLRRMDLCLIPWHDNPAPAPNVFVTVGPPNTARGDGAHLADRCLVLVGGVDPKSHHWDSRATLSQIETLVDRGQAALWTVSSSPRTPGEMVPLLQRLAARRANVRFFKSEETPAGWIEDRYAECDCVWVTADSVSMVYEALTAGCRVGILPVRWKRRDDKFRRGLNLLVEEGRVLVYDAWLQDPRKLPPRVVLDEASRCAQEILRRWWPDRLR